jgi:glucan 1,3-beta-glucosidase
MRPRWPAWLLLILMSVCGALWWWCAGRPVTVPDAPSSRIACVSYQPFRLAGETPYDQNAVIPPERIDADLRALSQRFDCVRIYSQGQGLDAVPAIAGRYGMKVLLGIWIGRDPLANARQIKLGIAAAQAYPQVVRAVIVGNEVLLRGEQSPEGLAAYIREVRAAVKEPVTYADVWEYWLRNPQLAGAVDYVTIHVLPYWEDQPVTPAHAIQHVATVYREVQRAFPGKPVMIGETGWPSFGRPRREVRATLVNEARYLREFLSYAATVDMPYSVIEAFDLPWKRAQEGTTGGYWGIFDIHARPKFSMQGPVVEIPRWWLGWLAGAAGALLFAAVGSWRRPWRGYAGWTSLALAGFASGTALAWQGRQMGYACGPWWEWALSGAVCVAALISALALAQRIAARLAGAGNVSVAGGWPRFGWLFALALYGLLLAFDGRYRDFPLGVFALPCVGYAIAAWLAPAQRVLPLVEERFLACWLPILGAAVVIEEAGLNTIAWLWLGLNLALAVPVLIAWRGARLKAHQA